MDGCSRLDLCQRDWSCRRCTGSSPERLSLAWGCTVATGYSACGVEHAALDHY